MLKQLNKLINVFAAIAIIVGSSTTMHAAEPLQQRVDRLVQPYLDAEIVVGMTIGVLHDGEEEFFSYGLTKQGGTKPNADTIYEIGSTSKVFTGVLLADAVTQGRVELDQPAGDLLPTGVKMPSRNGKQITLQHLATHVSGFPKLASNINPTDLENPYADYEVKDLYAYLNSHKLAHEPGTHREYSNTGTGLLGQLLANQQNLTFDQLLRERIAEPLQLSSTSVNVDAANSDRMAVPHMDVGLPTSYWDAPALAGAGTIKSTARDMIRFAKACLSPPKNKLGEALELAWEIHQEPLKRGQPAMGLGWHVIGGKTRMHNGQTGGFHSMLLVNRERQASVVLITNTSTTEVDRLAQDIVRLILGSDVKPRVFNQHKVKPDVLARYVGKFQLLPGLELDVTPDGDKLMVKLTGQPALRLYPDSDTKWHLRAVPAKVTFNVDDDGNCNSVDLHQNGATQTATRMSTVKPATAKTMNVKPEVMARYVGKYQFAPGLELVVAQSNGTLTVQLTGQPPLQIDPESATKWQVRGVPAKITFNVDSDGNCTSVELLQGGVRQTAQRLDGGKPMASNKPTKVTPELIASYVGKYQFAPGLELAVANTDGNLTVQLTGQQPLPIYSDTPTDWHLKVVPAKVKFNLDEDGNCTSVELLQNGTRQTATRLENGKPMVAKKEFKVAEEVLAKYVGKYQFATGGVLTVANDGGNMTVQLTGQQPLRIYADTKTEWHLKVVEAKITFNVDGRGNCRSVVLHQNGTKQTARRVD